MDDHIKSSWVSVLAHIKATDSALSCARFERDHAHKHLDCPRCKSACTPSVSIRNLDSGKYHVGAYCPSCGSWIKWLSRRSQS